VLARPRGWPHAWGQDNSALPGPCGALWRAVAYLCWSGHTNRRRETCTMSVEDCRPEAPNQAAERHSIIPQNTRCVDTPLAQWLQRCSYEPWVAGSSSTGSRALCEDAETSARSCSAKSLLIPMGVARVAALFLMPACMTLDRYPVNLSLISICVRGHQ
jgi:hypothetical protein